MILTSAFHFHDSNLMSQFIAEIPRHLLLDPVKKNRGIRNRYFKGMRIGGEKPTRQQFAMSYQTQVVEHQDGYLAKYLCLNWCGQKYGLVQSTLELLGIGGQKDLESAINRIHEMVSTEGHEKFIEAVAQNLSFDHMPEELAILTAIACANVSDVESVKKHLKNSLDLLMTDPAEMIRALQPKVEAIVERQQQLSEMRNQAETRRQEETSKYQRDVRKIDRRASKTKDALDETETKIQELESQIHILQEQLNPLEHDRMEQTDALERDDKARSKLRTTYEKQKTTIDQSLESIGTEFERASQELTEYRVLIAGAEAKIEDERAKAEEASIVKGVKEKKVVTQDSQEVPKRQPSQSEFFDSLLGDIKTGNFTSSSLTLEVLEKVRSGKLKKGRCSKQPTSKSVENAQEWVKHTSRKAVNSNWNTGELAAYAYWRSLTQPTEDRNVQRGYLISGLYHAFPENDTWIDPLLIRLLESLTGAESEVCLSETPSHELLTALERTEDTADKHQMGAAQVELAFADGRLLTRLYDLIGGRSRLMLKRTLVGSILETIDVDEKHPTHELLDIVVTQLDSIRAVFGSKFANWRGQASLESIGSDRQEILNAMAKLKPLVDDLSRLRLEDCRKILSTEVTRALKSQTHEGYTRLLSRCMVYIRQELEAPVWISSRFLFPIVIETARAGLGAEREARRFLKADLVSCPMN